MCCVYVFELSIAMNSMLMKVVVEVRAVVTTFLEEI